MYICSYSNGCVPATNYFENDQIFLNLPLSEGEPEETSTIVYDIVLTSIVVPTIWLLTFRAKNIYDKARQKVKDLHQYLWKPPNQKLLIKPILELEEEKLKIIDTVSTELVQKVMSELTNDLSEYDFVNDQELES